MVRRLKPVAAGRVPGLCRAAVCVTTFDDASEQTRLCVGGRSIPVIFGLEGGLAILVLGVALFLVGWRQRRAERDITSIPWVSPLLKTVAGSFLAAYGLINIVVVYLAS